jgi:AcrR family transcriptional regulator
MQRVIMAEKTKAPGKKKSRLRRQDWIVAALQALEENGVDGIKIVVIAECLNVTSGSFYWHFSGLRQLLNAVLEHWELTLTDRVIELAREHEGEPAQRIFNLMVEVIESDAAAPDHAISVWARRDPLARQVYERTIDKRFQFAKWMFEQAGFRKAEAAARGRLMVTCLMGESSTALKSKRNWKAKLKEQFEVLVFRH